MKYINTKEFRRVHDRLKKAARDRSTMSYQPLALLMDLPLTGDHMRREADRMLMEINEYEHRYGRPMLSSLVVDTDTLRPGDGYWQCAIALGKLLPAASPQERAIFWRRELAEVYTAWG